MEEIIVTIPMSRFEELLHKETVHDAIKYAHENNMLYSETGNIFWGKPNEEKTDEVVDDLPYCLREEAGADNV